MKTKYGMTHVLNIQLHIIHMTI